MCYDRILFWIWQICISFWSFINYLVSIKENKSKLNRNKMYLTLIFILFELASYYEKIVNTEWQELGDNANTNGPKVQILLAATSVYIFL